MSVNLEVLPSLVPQSVPLSAILAAVEQGLAQSGRFDEGEASITVLVDFQTPNYVVQLTLLAPPECHRLASGADRLVETARQAALCFARTDPREVIHRGLYAAMIHDLAGLKESARRLAEIGQAREAVEVCLTAVDFYELAGDLSLAEETLLQVHSAVPWPNQASLGYRLAGLHLAQRMGQDYLGLVLELGALAANFVVQPAEVRELGQMMLLLMRLGVLRLPELQSPHWEPVPGLMAVLERSGGGFGIELFKLAFYAVSGDAENVLQTGFKVVPWLVRLAPELSQELAGPQGVTLERARPIVEQRQWQRQRWLRLTEDEQGLNEVLREHPLFADALYQRALARGVRQDRAGSFEDLSRLLEFCSCHSDARYLQATLLLQSQRQERAVYAFRETIRRNPWELNAYLDLGWALSEQEEPGEALEWIDRALVLLPEELLAKAHFFRGSILMILERDAEAVESLQRSLDLDFDQDFGYLHLGVCLRRLKRFPEALVALDRGLERVPDEVGARWHRAHVFLKLQRIPQATADFEAVAAALPDTAMGLDALARIKEIRNPHLLARLFGSTN